MVLRLRGAHRLVERLTQVDDRRWSLQKVCRTLARVAGCEMAMLTKSDDQEYGYLRLIYGLPLLWRWLSIRNDRESAPWSRFLEPQPACLLGYRKSIVFWKKYRKWLYECDDDWRPKSQDEWLRTRSPKHSSVDAVEGGRVNHDYVARSDKEWEGKPAWRVSLVGRSIEKVESSRIPPPSFYLSV